MGVHGIDCSRDAKMRIAFITEGGKDFGMGHVFRTLTLAQDLGKNIEIRFFSKSGEVVLNKITASGFKLKAYTKADELLPLLVSFEPDAVVFDCLDVNPSIVLNIKKSIRSRVIIFDNETQANEYADTVINALVSKDFLNRKFYSEQNRTIYMFGPRYLILNKLFQEPKNDRRETPENAKNLLVAFGGSDPLNKTTYTLDRILRYFSENETSPRMIDVVLGPHFEYEMEMNLVLAENKEKARIAIHKDVSNLYEHIRKADLVITSPGLTMFESLSMGTHTIVMYQNELQKRVYSGLFQKLGKDSDYYGLSSMGYYLNPNHQLIQEMQIGKSREEVIETITHFKSQEPRVSLRQATDDDLKRIIDWRSDPIIFKWFYTQNAPLVWDEHVRWWQTRKDRVDWIIILFEEGKDVPVGSINCTNIQGARPEIGLFVGETAYWGKSIGKLSVSFVVGWLRERGFEMAFSRVMKDNIRSRHLFESLGFENMGFSRPGENLYRKML